MKKLISILIVAAFSIYSISSLAYGANSVLVSSGSQEDFLNDQSVSENAKEGYLLQYLEEHNIHTLDQYAAWLKNNIRYEKDTLTSKQWISWPITLNRKYGDCKAISSLNKKVLEFLGYQPLLIGYKNATMRNGHVFTVFLKEGQFHIFDNTNLYKTKAQTLDEIAMLIYKQYNIDVIFEVSLEPQNFKILYTRTMLAEILNEVLTSGTL